MASVAKSRRKQAAVERAPTDRSLGFIPLLLMTLIYLICTVFSDAIGPITSAPGMFRLNVDNLRRGCEMPTPSA